MRMLMLYTPRFVVFFYYKNWEEARKFRKLDARFKRRHIRDVIQMYPDGIEFGTVYKSGYGQLLIKADN